MRLARTLIIAALISFQTLVEANAETIRIQNHLVANALTEIFAETTVWLDGSGVYHNNSHLTTGLIPWGSYNVRGRSKLRFKPPATLLQREFDVEARELKWTRPLSDTVVVRYVNIAQARTRLTEVTEAADGSSFELFFRLRANSPFIAEDAGVPVDAKCRLKRLHRQAGNDVPCQTGSTRLFWVQPNIKVILKPHVHAGALSFFAETVTFTGTIGGVTACAGENPLEWDTDCRMIYEKYLPMHSDMTVNSRSFARDFIAAFNNREIQANIALAVLNRLRDAGLSGRIQEASAEGGQLRIEQ